MGDAPGIPTRINGGEVCYTIGVGVLHTATISFAGLGVVTRIVSVFIAMPDVYVGRYWCAAVIHIHQLQFNLQRHTRFILHNILAQNK